MPSNISICLHFLVNIAYTVQFGCNVTQELLFNTLVVVILIFISFYVKARNSNMRNRPVGIGVQVRY